MKSKNIITLLILVVFLFGGFGAYLFTNNPSPKITITTESTKTTGTLAKSDTVSIFYSSTCPHCTNVEDFLKKEAGNLTVKTTSLKIDDPVKDKANLSIALQRVKECNLGDSWGVPLMYHNGKCLMGDVPIIDYLTQLKKGN